MFVVSRSIETEKDKEEPKTVMLRIRNHGADHESKVRASLRRRIRYAESPTCYRRSVSLCMELSRNIR